jgi:hypothetical protein
MKRLVLCVVLTVLAARPLAAHAQPPAPAAAVATDQADELTHRAVDSIKADRWAEAEDLLLRAWALKHSYDIAGNLGLAELGLRKWRLAAEHLSFALATFPANGKPAHRELLIEKFAAAREHVGAVTIEVDVPGADVLVDGKSVGMAPLAAPAFVDPGTHVIEARLAGRTPAREQATIAAGASTIVKLTLPLTTPPPDRTPRIAVAATAGGLALVGLAVGAGLTVATNSKAAEVARLSSLGGSSACFDVRSSPCATLHDAVSSKATLSDAAAASFIVGGAFALVGAGLGIWAAQAPRVVPVVGTSSAGLVYQRRW